MASPEAPLDCHGLSDCPRFWWPHLFWMLIIRYFAVSFKWYVSNIFLIIRLQLRVLGGDHKVRCHFHHFISNLHTTNMTYCRCWPWPPGWHSVGQVYPQSSYSIFFPVPIFPGGDNTLSSYFRSEELGSTYVRTESLQWAIFVWVYFQM